MSEEGEAHTHLEAYNNVSVPLLRLHGGDTTQRCRGDREEEHSKEQKNGRQRLPIRVHSMPCVSLGQGEDRGRGRTGGGEDRGRGGGGEDRGRGRGGAGGGGGEGEGRTG